MGLMGTIHKTEGRWDKSDNKRGEATTAAYCPHLRHFLDHTLYWHSCFIISLSLFAVHHGFTACFKSLDMKTRWGGGIQGAFGWLNVCVCVRQKDKELWFDELWVVRQSLPSGPTCCVSCHESWHYCSPLKHPGTLSISITTCCLSAQCHTSNLPSYYYIYSFDFY